MNENGKLLIELLKSISTTQWFFIIWFAVVMFFVRLIFVIQRRSDRRNFRGFSEGAGPHIDAHSRRLENPAHGGGAIVPVKEKNALEKGGK